MSLHFWLFWGALLTTLMGVGAPVSAALIPPPTMLRGSDLKPTNLKDAMGAIPSGVVVIGEAHGTAAHQSYQLMMMKELRRIGWNVTNAMEFLEYPYQKQVNDYRLGWVSEADFLKIVKWGGDNFQYYRDQILFPKGPKDTTLAINAPRAIVDKIAFQGLNSLTSAELQMLPPSFERNGRGNDAYFERFKTTNPHNITDPQQLENFFWAQSAWDDTMAWQVSEYLKNSLDHLVVIVVGDFHVRYGGGLPDRLRQHGIPFVHTVSLVNTYGMSQADIDREIAVDPVAGPRADEIWLSSFETPPPQKSW